MHKVFSNLADLAKRVFTGETGRRQREIHEAFFRYLSPHAVAELAHTPERLVLGHEMRLITIMFCDIQGFTGMSEHMTALDLGLLINEFLTPMTEIIMERQGTIDKYIGGRIIAFWNAPLDDPDHAKNAVVAAQEMRCKVIELNERWAAGGRPKIYIAIGINSGECSVGNFGSQQRFNYSVLGHPVDLAEHLVERAPQIYGVDLILGEDTAELLHEPDLMELGVIGLKGRSRAIRIYTLPHPVQTEDRERIAQPLLEPDSNGVITLSSIEDAENSSLAVNETRAQSVDPMTQSEFLKRLKGGGRRG